MKKTFFTFVAIIMTATLSYAQVPSYVPTNGLLAWYPLDGNSNDATINGNNAVNTDVTFATNRFGTANSSASFNGTTSGLVVTTPSFSLSETTPFTYSFWINHDTLTTGGIVLMTAGSDNYGFVSLLGADRGINYSLGKQWVGWSGLYSCNLDNTVWDHYVAVYDPPTMKMYKNGVLCGTSTFSQLGSVSVNYPLYIGHDWTGSGFYTGLIDDIGIWNRVLTETEIEALQNCTLAVTTNPINQNVIVGGSAQFSTTCNDVTANYQWQTNTGNGFVNCVDGVQFSGSTTATLTFSNIMQTISNQPFRCLITSGFCNVTTNEALLTVSNQLAPEILYYKFDGTGTSVPNLATTPPSGAITATIMGGVSQGSNGQCGSALVGSGVSSTTDYLNTNWNTNFGTNSWTISFWSSGFSDKTTLDYIFGDATANSFRCFTNGVAGANNWILRGGGLVDVPLTGGALTTPTLNTFVYDNTTNEVKAYLNGVLVNTVAQTSVNIVGTSPFKVMGYNTNIGAPVGGLLDEFRVYNRALTGAEVLALNSTSVTGVDMITTCHEYTWVDGVSYTENNNTATHTLAGGSYTGCDSIVRLNLTILPISNSTSVHNICSGSDFTYSDGTSSTNIIADESHVSTLIGAAANGCDSIVTENLVVIPVASSQTQHNLCHGSNFIYIDGTAINNLVANESHVSTLVGASYTGCDSLVTENLVIYPVASSENQQTLCHGSNFTYTDGTTVTNLVADESHISTLVGASYTGCDSLVTENLIVLPAINTSVSTASNTITTTLSGAGYQWLDCNNGFAIIPNANEQTYTALDNGSYAVEITIGNCADTSYCINITTIGINETSILSDQISVYPNPANDYFTIVSNVTNGKVTIMDMLGKVVISQILNTANQPVSTSNMKNGMYMVEVRSLENEIIGRTRIVIHK